MSERNRKNKPSSMRVLLSVSLVMLLLTFVTGSAFAKEYDLAEGSIFVSGGANAYTVKVGEGEGKTDTDDSVTIYQSKGEDKSKEYTVTIENTGDNAQVNIHDVEINAPTGQAGITVNDDVTINLSGDNTIVGAEGTDTQAPTAAIEIADGVDAAIVNDGYSAYTGGSAKEGDTVSSDNLAGAAGIEMGEGASLTLDGNGYTSAVGGNGGSNPATTGNPAAAGIGGAGIGGKSYTDGNADDGGTDGASVNITVDGGYYYVQSGYGNNTESSGAAMGGGSSKYGDGGSATVDINGGEVFTGNFASYPRDNGDGTTTYSGVYSPAAIGGGCGVNGGAGNVTIDGGTVYAISGSAPKSENVGAAIGNGSGKENDAQNGSVVINDGVVTAFQGGSGDAQPSPTGLGGDGSTVKVTGGVLLTDNPDAADIKADDGEVLVVTTDKDGNNIAYTVDKDGKKGDTVELGPDYPPEILDVIYDKDNNVMMLGVINGFDEETEDFVYDNGAYFKYQATDGGVVYTPMTQEEIDEYEGVEPEPEKENKEVSKTDAKKTGKTYIKGDEFASLTLSKLGKYVPELKELDTNSRAKDFANLMEWAEQKNLLKADEMKAKDYMRCGKIARILCQAANVSYSGTTDEEKEDAALAALAEKNILKGYERDDRITNTAYNRELNKYIKEYFEKTETQTDGQTENN